MKLDDYQKEALKRSAFPEITGPFLFPLLGMCGELGELFEKVKKQFRDNGGEITPEFREGIKGEAGDILWYLVNFINEFDITFEEIAQGNIDKCEDRRKRKVIHGDGDYR